MAADGKLPPNDPNRRNYNGVIDAIKRIAAEEGVAKLWEGAAPTVARAILLNAGQLAVYSQAKESIASSTPLTGIPLQFVSSLVSATAAVALSCPADVIKSRMQVCIRIKKGKEGRQEGRKEGRKKGRDEETDT